MSCEIVLENVKMLLDHSNTLGEVTAVESVVVLVTVAVGKAAFRHVTPGNLLPV